MRHRFTDKAADLEGVQRKLFALIAQTRKPDRAEFGCIEQIPDPCPADIG